MLERIGTRFDRGGVVVEHDSSPGERRDTADDTVNVPSTCAHSHGGVSTAGAMPPPALRRRTVPHRVASAVLHGALVLVLTISTFLVFIPVLRCGFVYDDVVTIVGNRLIDTLTPAAVARLFAGFHQNDYYPVLYLSLAIDRAVWDFNPIGFHLTNLVLHILNVLMVYALVHRVVFRRMVGAGETVGASRWVIATVAAVLFAVHPNHVEPVAWLSGRKVLLAGFWGLLAVHSYLTAPARPVRRRSFVLASCACTALACMSNVYALVVPAFVVLSDRYVAGQAWWTAVRRNWPFGSIAVVAIIFKIASRIGGVEKPGPFGSRLEWLTATVCTYGLNVRSLFTRGGRNVLYPYHPVETFADPRFVFGVTAILTTFILIWALRRRSLWMYGLCWFLFALAPTSQLARHHILRADRYLYLPDVGSCLLGGLLFALVIGWSKRVVWRVPVSVACLILLARLAIASNHRAGDWRDDATLWAASLAQDERNADAHQSLGCARMRQGRVEEAERHLRRAIELNPRHPDAYNTLCVLLTDRGEIDGAVAAGTLAVQIRPDYAEAKFNLGRALSRQRRYGAAVEQFRSGLALKPGDIGAYYYMGQALSQAGRWDEAIAAYEKALSVNANYIEARYALALALARSDQADRARSELTRVVELQPGFAEAHCRLGELALRCREYGESIRRFRAAVAARPDLNEPKNNLAWVLATCPDEALRNGAESMAIVKPLVEGAGRDDPRVWDTFAAAHAEQGRFVEAIEAARRAIELADRAGQVDGVDAMRKRVEQYAAGRPWREP